MGDQGKAQAEKGWEQPSQVCLDAVNELIVSERVPVTWAAEMDASPSPLQMTAVIVRQSVYKSMYLLSDLIKQVLYVSHDKLMLFERGKKSSIQLQIN